MSGSLVRGYSLFNLGVIQYSRKTPGGKRQALRSRVPPCQSPASGRSTGPYGSV